MYIEYVKSFILCNIKRVAIYTFFIYTLYNNYGLFGKVAILRM